MNHYWKEKYDERMEELNNSGSATPCETTDEPKEGGMIWGMDGVKAEDFSYKDAPNIK